VLIAGPVIYASAVAASARQAIGPSWVWWKSRAAGSSRSAGENRGA